MPTTPPSRAGLRAALLAATPAARPLRGPFISIPSPVAVEIMAAAGPDFICLEGEHAALRGGLLADMLRAADLFGVPALVRVPEAMPWLIAEALDAGACGVLVPRIASAAQAAEVVRASRFPPEGGRGAGPGRAAGYGYDIAGYIDRARSGTLVALQIESIEGITALPQILQVPGIDLIFVGPGDLSISLAAAGRPGPAALQGAIAEIGRLCAAAGMPLGLFTPQPPVADPALPVAFFIQSSDAILLQTAARAAFAPTATGGTKQG